MRIHGFHKWLIGITLLSASLLSGCRSGAVDVAEVLNYAQCRGLAQRLTPLAFADLARVRGAELLPESTSAATPAPEQDSLLLAVFNGRQPTPGYALVLDSASPRAAGIELRYQWQSPAPDAMQAQVVTTPCSVVEITGLSPGQTIDVLLDGEPFASCQLNSASAASARSETLCL